MNLLSGEINTRGDDMNGWTAVILIAIGIVIALVMLGVWTLPEISVWVH